MDMMSFFAKFLSPEKQKAVAQVLPLLKEKAIADDLNIALSEIEKTIAVSSKTPKIDKGLKEAFNDAAALSSIGKAYLKDGTISIFTAPKLVSIIGRFKDGSQVLRDAFNAQQPDAIAFAQALKTNDAFYNAIKRLVVNTNERLFRLEAGEDGGGYAAELITGKSMKVALKKEDYEKIQKALASSQKASPPTLPTL